jgi:N-acyl-phosphatidylethanolamine-hydrolysing phospholipase D
MAHSPAAALAAFAALLSSCTVVNPYFDPAKPHHTPEGFRNNYAQVPAGGWGRFFKWKYEEWKEGAPKPPANGYRFPMAQPDLAFLQSNRSEPSITWVGHATLLLQVAGANILTDPHFSSRASPLSFAGPERKVPPGIALEQLPHIDLVLISHNHYDHLDEETVKRLAAQPGGPPQFFVPLGVKPWMQAIGIERVIELDWWDSREFQGLTLQFLPVQHWSRRSLTDTNRTLWGGWAVLHPSLRFFFSGDTGYSQDFRDIRARLGAFDLAAIPIGAYEPRWFMGAQHVDPAQAVKIHQDLGARYSVGIHWGTFQLTDEPLDEPPFKLAEARTAAGIPGDRFFVMRHGETRRLDFLRKP